MFTIPDMFIPIRHEIDKHLIPLKFTVHNFLFPCRISSIYISGCLLNNKKDITM